MTSPAPPRDLVVLDGEVLLPDGTMVSHVHDPAQCRGRACIVHNPVDHAMRSWPLALRRHPNGALVFFRVCVHGTAHPDPSQYAWWEQVGEWERAQAARVGIPAGWLDASDSYRDRMAAHPCCPDRCCETPTADTEAPR